VWAVGCVFSELLTGQPLWPGKGDVDQLYLMRKTLGDLLPRHMSIYDSNAFFKGIQLEAPDYYEPLEEKMQGVTLQAMNFLKMCLNMDPCKRSTCEDLLNHSYFDGFREWFEPELARLVNLEKKSNPDKKLKPASNQAVIHATERPTNPPPEDHVLPLIKGSHSLPYDTQPGHLKPIEKSYRHLPAILKNPGEDPNTSSFPKHSMLPSNQSLSNQSHGNQQQFKPLKQYSDQASKHFDKVDFKYIDSYKQFDRFADRNYDSRHNARDNYHHPYDNFK